MWVNIARACGRQTSFSNVHIFASTSCYITYDTCTNDSCNKPAGGAVRCAGRCVACLRRVIADTAVPPDSPGQASTSAICCSHVWCLAGPRRSVSDRGPTSYIQFTAAAGPYPPQLAGPLLSTAAYGRAAFIAELTSRPSPPATSPPATWPLASRRYVPIASRPVP